MISYGLQSWQQQKRLRIEGDVVYGVYQGLGFSVTEEDGGKLFVFMLNGSDSAYDALENNIAAQYTPLRELQVGDVENYLALFYDEMRGEMPAALMDAMLDFVVATARTCGFRTPTTCVKCGAPAQKRAFSNGLVQPFCANCREAEKASARPNPVPTPAPTPAPEAYQNPYAYTPTSYYPPTQQNEVVNPNIEHHSALETVSTEEKSPAVRGEGTLVKGLLGAFIGAVAGLVPYFVSVLLGLELGALCFLSGIGAVIGYTLFGGLRKKSTAIATCIAVPVVLSIVGVIVVAISGGGGLFAETMDYITFLMAVVGVLLGITVSLDRVNKYVE